MARDSRAAAVRLKSSHAGGPSGSLASRRLRECCGGTSQLSEVNTSAASAGGAASAESVPARSASARSASAASASPAGPRSVGARRGKRRRRGNWITRRCSCRECTSSRNRESLPWPGFAAPGPETREAIVGQFADGTLVGGTWPADALVAARSSCGVQLLHPVRPGYAQAYPVSPPPATPGRRRRPGVQTIR